MLISTLYLGALEGSNPGLPRLLKRSSKSIGWVEGGRPFGFPCMQFSAFPKVSRRISLFGVSDSQSEERFSPSRCRKRGIGLCWRTKHRLDRFSKATRENYRDDPQYSLRFLGAVVEGPCQAHGHLLSCRGIPDRSYYAQYPRVKCQDRRFLSET